MFILGTVTVCADTYVDTYGSVSPFQGRPYWIDAY